MKYLALIVLSFSLTAEACIPRSQSAKTAFAKLYVCPSTGLHRSSCAGYVIDHIRPMACGGLDTPKNMQWQTVAEGLSKDKWERKGC